MCLCGRRDTGELKKKVSEYWLLNFEAYLILLERMNYRRVKLQIHAGMLVVARSHC